MTLAAINLELLGQSLWWIAAVAVTGIALLVYAEMLRRERRDLREESLGRLKSNHPREQQSLRLLGFPLSALAATLGIAAIAIAIPILFLGGTLTQWLGFAWTLLVILCAVFLFYRRVYRYLSRFRMTVLFSLRALGLFALTLLLFQPVLGFVRTPDHRPRVAIIVDASASMSFSDAINEPNRFMQAAIAVQDTLAPRLEKAFDVQIFAYDGKHTAPLDGADALRTIPPDGEVTDLGAAAGMGIENAANQIILISDGIHNGATSIAGELPAITIPVHTVRVGSSDIEPSSVPDIAVISVEGPQTATVNNQITLTASIKSTAMSDRTVRVILNGPDKTGAPPLDEQRLVLHSGVTPQTVKLKFTPDKVGRAVVRISVPVDPGERSAANNEQDFAVIVTDPKLAVLYVEGRVRPRLAR